MGDQRRRPSTPPSVGLEDILTGLGALAVGVGLTYGAVRAASAAGRLLAPDEDEVQVQRVGRRVQHQPSRGGGGQFGAFAATAATAAGAAALAFGAEHLLSPSDGDSPAQRFFDGRARQEDFAALGVGAAGGAALTYGLTRLLSSSEAGGDGPVPQVGPPDDHSAYYRGQNGFIQRPLASSSSTHSEGSSQSFWNKWNFWSEVDSLHEEEIRAIDIATGDIKPESAVPIRPRYRHRHNEFDQMFQNVLRNIRINVSDRQNFTRAFDEVMESLLPEMKRVDPLFEFIFREYHPAGSSWEDLRICSPDEFDVNLVLFPLNIQTGVTVDDLHNGHIGVCVPGGFKVEREHVSKKCKLITSHPDSCYASICANLKNWLDYNSCIKADSVRKWMQSVVDKARKNLQSDKKWELIQTISCSVSGPAITVTVIQQTGAKFSIDLVPAFEFSKNFLPIRVIKKIDAKTGGNRTWYAIPKGPRGDNDPKKWRTSLYEYERDLMRGKQLLKPCIRIMKRLKDWQNWKELASYYIKTLHMWEMEGRESWRGLGQMMMNAMEMLEKSMRDQSIKYYWDENLNLIQGTSVDPAYYTNVANCLRNIIKRFEQSIENQAIDPVLCFGCDKDGNDI